MFFATREWPSSARHARSGDRYASRSAGAGILQQRP